MFLPAHYLKKFHPAYTAKDDIDKPGAGRRLQDLDRAVRQRATRRRRIPSVRPWRPGCRSSRVSDPVFTLRRNPYYVGVDTDGNQLPYIDEVRFTYFADAQALNLAAIAGNFDMQERHIQMTNYPVLKEQEKTGKYRVITWPTFGGADAVIAINLTYTADPEMGKLMADEGLPHRAVARDQPRPDQGVACSSAWARRARACRRRGIRTSRARSGRRSTPSSIATRPTRCSTASASTRRTPQGIRLMPNGKPATIEISVVPAFGAWPDVAQLVAKDWEAVGIKTIVQIRERALHFKMNENNELMAEIWNEDTTRVPVHRQRQVRPAQCADPDAWGRCGAAGTRPAARRASSRSADEAHRRDRRQGAHRRAGGAGQALRRSCSASGRTTSTRSAPSGLTPMVQGVVVINTKFHNVPTTLGNDWPLRSPGNARTEQFYFTK